MHNLPRIQLRACVKIGELSRELPKGKPGPKPGNGKLSGNDVAQFDKEKKRCFNEAASKFVR
jgi:hypothetical protein